MHIFMYSRLRIYIELDMPEKEQDIEITEYTEIIENLSYVYPQLQLNPPLFYSDFDQYIQGMNSYEFKFANYLCSMGLYVFREPRIESCFHIPDFFVFNQSDCTGTLLELTLYNRDFTNCNTHKRPRNEVKKTIERKKGQIQELENCGIPYMVLYREDLEIIRREYIKDLF